MAYFIDGSCIGCKKCQGVCPQKCINTAVTPAVIDGFHCLNCGNCAEVCPVQAVRLQEI